MKPGDDMGKVEMVLGTLVIIVAVIMLFFFFAEVADAAPVEEDTRIGSQIFNTDHTRLPDDSNAYYQIDVTDTTEEEQSNSAAENFIEGVTNFNPIKDTAESTMMETITMATNMILEWNMMMVNLMIGVLNFGFETEIINAWIDMMDGLVQQMAGVSGANITGGVFGSLLGLATTAAGLVAVYQILVHKAIMGGLQTILKMIVVLTAAFILFANFAPMMKGMNTISTEISASLLTGTTNLASGDNRSPEEVRAEVGSHLWENFIGRPYLILQYGSDNAETIGLDRINTLLAMKPGEDRQQYVDEIEVGERGNETMTYPSTLERFAFSIIYSVINALVSLPVFGLALALIIFQLWFLMIAFYAPFALVQAAFPGQFDTLKRYAIELTYPLFCKILVTVATLFIFTIGFAIYNIPPLPETVGISQYFVASILQFGMFGVFFIFRKRIGRIIGAGRVGPYDVVRQDIMGLKQTLNTTAGSVVQTAVHVGAAAATGGSSTAITAAVAAAQHSSQPEDQTDQQPAAPLASMDDHPAETVAETVTKESEPITTIQEEAAQQQPMAEAEGFHVEPGDPITEEAQPAEQHEDLSTPLASLDDMEAPVHQISIKDDEADATYKGDGPDDRKVESGD